MLRSRFPSRSTSVVTTRVRLARSVAYGRTHLVTKSMPRGPQFGSSGNSGVTVRSIWSGQILSGSSRRFGLGVVSGFVFGGAFVGAGLDIEDSYSQVT